MRLTVGASEIAAIVGADPYRSPQEQWAINSGLVEYGPANEHIIRGKCLENGLIDWWAATSAGGKVVKRQVKCRPKRRCVHATPDALVETNDGFGVRRWLLEVKAPAGGKAWDDRSGKYPVQYGMQVVFQLGVAAMCGVSVSGGILAAGPIWGRLMRFEIQHDEELFGLLLSRAERFIGHVKRGEELPGDWLKETA